MNGEPPKDCEQFSLDDDITRRHIYRIMGPRNDIVSSIGVNFVASCFKKGATQWGRDLEEPYASLYHKLMNLSAFAIGNKKIDSVLHTTPTTAKKRRTDNLIVVAASIAVDAWYGRCRNNDNITIDIETLFDATITNQVNGFRIWLHSRITKKVATHAPLTIPPILAPIRPSIDENVPVDVLGAALRHSLLEAHALKSAYTFQRDRFMLAKNKTKKPITPKLNADAALYSLYNYANHDTMVKCFANILRKGLDDPSRVSGETTHPVFPAFKDSREIMDVQYNIDDERNTTNLIRDLFSKEAAMFYHVRTANIMSEQRDLNNYISFVDRVCMYNPDTVNDVSQLIGYNIKDSSFNCYYNDQTTYHLKNEHVSAEFYHNMPLPHRIGAHLPTREKVGNANVKDGDDSEAENESSSITAKTIATTKKKGFTAVLHEDDDYDDEDGDEDEDGEKEKDDEEVDLSSSTSSLSVREIPDYVNEEWLAENDPDGTMAARLLDVPTSYGFKDTVLRPLGLHQVTYTVNKRRILACKSSAYTTKEIEEMTDEFKNTFMNSRREKVTFLVQQTVLQGGGKQCNQQKLLACDHAAPGGTINSKGSITVNSIDPIDASANNEVYRASTLNYIVNTVTHSSPIDTISDKPEEEDDGESEEDTVDIDGDKDDTLNGVPGFRCENGDFVKDSDTNDTTTDGTRKPRFYCNKQLDELIPFLKRPMTPNKSYDPEWESFIANATLEVFLPIIEMRRPKGNTMDDVNASPDMIRDEEWMLERDVYLRMCVLNKKAYRGQDRDFFDQKTRKIPDERYGPYKKEKRNYVTASFIEVWNEFFTSPDVSYANEGIRGDWNKSTIHIADGKKQINHSHHTRVTRLDVLPYHQYKIWCYELFSVVLDVHYNYKIMYNNYTAKYHHCRWLVDSTDPHLNIIDHGDNMGGKSFILKNVKKTCPSMVGDMVSQITDKAFNVDRNLNDMLIIIEEMENKYLGIMPGGAKGSAGNGESDALSFFKNRLTSGIASVIHFFLDEENGNRRDCKQAKSSCQGSYLCATNARLADADKHLLSRFTLQSVPKSFGDKTKTGPKIGSGDVKPQFSTETRQHDIIYEEHKDVHRLYYLTEQAVKSGVLVNNKYGTSIDGANLMISTILTKMHIEHGIPTDNGRKRNSILELARCMCIAFACWNALTSPVLRHLQYEPLTGEYIGINPRVIIHGVFPFLVINKDMVIDALTSFSGLWQHDHLDNVLKSIIVSTNLIKPVAGKYRLVTESELESSSTVDFSDPRNKGQPQAARRPPVIVTPSTTGAVRAASGAMQQDGRMPMQSNSNRVGIATQNGLPVYLNAVPDYNYVCLVERSYDMIYKNISKQLGELQISSNDVEKILTELSEETYDVALPSYTLEKNVEVTNPTYGTLVVDSSVSTVSKLKLVIIDHCPRTKRPRVNFYIPYLKDHGSLMLPDNLVQDARRFQEQFDNLDDSDEEKAKETAKENEMDNDNDNEGSDNDDDDNHVVGEIEDDTLHAIIAKLEKSARYEARGETPLIQTTTSSYENSINDLTCVPLHIERALRKEYTTVYGRCVPWENHCTADHPSAIATSDIYKASAHAIKHNNQIGKEITFYDTMKSLTLRRKGTAEVIIPNHSYVSPSAMATLSIFDPLITDNDVIKSTQSIYNQSSSWKLLECIHFTDSKAHLANIGYEPMDNEDIRFRCINYHPFLYQIHADYSRTRLDKYKKEVDTERKERKKQFVESGDLANIAILKKEKEDAHVASVMCEYPLCSMLSKVNHQGDIINNTLYGCDSNSVVFHEMILANSEQMKKDYAFLNASMIRAKKRIQYRDEGAKQKAREKVHLIYKKRLRMRTVVDKNLQKSRKRHHSGIAKASVNHKNIAEELQLQSKEAQLRSKEKTVAKRKMMATGAL